jgi:hypothetical protein
MSVVGPVVAALLLGLRQRVDGLNAGALGANVEPFGDFAVTAIFWIAGLGCGGGREKLMWPGFGAAASRKGNQVQWLQKRRVC